jgi:hypothetical protein
MTRALPENHPYRKDPLKGLATARGLSSMFATSLIGALAALALFGALFPLRLTHMWLDRSIWEGLVFGGSVAVFLLVLILLTHLYMTRPLLALARERGLDPVAARPAAPKPSLGPQLVVILVLVACLALALWSEYRFKDLLENTGFQNQGLGMRLLNPHGYPIPAGVGMVITAFAIVLANSLRGWWAWARR